MGLSTVLLCFAFFGEFCLGCFFFSFVICVCYGCLCVDGTDIMLVDVRSGIWVYCCW